MSQKSPEQFGKYELLKRLAFGGMAEIFLARLCGEGGFSKQLVVKRILPQFGEDSQFVKMFIDEAVLVAHINHPNVVQVYDFGSTDNVYFIAMEYVDGADLRQILRYQSKNDMKMSFAQVAAIGEGAAAGLACAHAAVDSEGKPLQIVHRDVSPHNVMVGRSGDVKVMDFGIAKAEVRATKTATGTIKGKVAYMAPEHGSGEQADARSDQFSLGAVLWECIAGQRLYQGDSELEVLRNVLDWRVRPLASVRPDVPDELAQIIHSMLERDPEGRFKTMTEVRDALSRFRYTLGPEGAVDLGKLVPPPTPEVPLRASGTLVLEDDPSALPTASEPLLPGDKPETDANTASLSEASAVFPGTATLPMEDEPTVPVELLQEPEKKANKLWAVLLVLLVAGALGWISHQGQARMDAQATKSAAPAVEMGVVMLSSDPAGAIVIVNGQALGLVTPATLPPVAVGTSLTLELQLKGYQVWQQTMVVEQSQVTQSAALKINKPVEVKAKKSTKKPLRTSRKVKKPLVKKETKQVSKRRALEPGRLFLRSGGLWFHVFLDGKQIGTTPLAGVSVPAGSHTLVLKNSVAGVERKLDIKVEPGAVIRRTVKP